jgi:hypothetical protein
MTPEQRSAIVAAESALIAGNASLTALAEAVRVLRESLYDPVPPPPPPADPLPPTPPKTRLQPDLTNAPEPAQYLLDDGGAGPSYRHWSTHLSLPWRTQDVGDWTDAAGASNGRAPYASAAIAGPGAVEIDVTDLARSLAVGHGRLYVASSAEGIVRIRKRLPDDKPPNGPQYRRGKAEYDEAALRLIHGPRGFGHWGWDLPTGSADMQAFLSSH